MKVFRSAAAVALLLAVSLACAESARLEDSGDEKVEESSTPLYVTSNSGDENVEESSTVTRTEYDGNDEGTGSSDDVTRREVVCPPFGLERHAAEELWSRVASFRDWKKCPDARNDLSAWVTRAPIPDHLHVKVWKSLGLTASTAAKVEEVTDLSMKTAMDIARVKLVAHGEYPEVYEKELLNIKSPPSAKEITLQCVDQVKKDTPRSNNKLKNLVPEINKHIELALVTFCLLDEQMAIHIPDHLQVGYCQSMDSIAGSLLYSAYLAKGGVALAEEDVEFTVWMLFSFMDVYGLRPMYSTTMPGIACVQNSFKKEFGKMTESANWANHKYECDDTCQDFALLFNLKGLTMFAEDGLITDPIIRIVWDTLIVFGAPVVTATSLYLADALLAESEPTEDDDTSGLFNLKKAMEVLKQDEKRAEDALKTSEKLEKQAPGNESIESEWRPLISEFFVAPKGILAIAHRLAGENDSGLPRQYQCKKKAEIPSSSPLGKRAWDGLVNAVKAARRSY